MLINKLINNTNFNEKINFLKFILIINRHQFFYLHKYNIRISIQYFKHIVKILVLSQLIGFLF